MPQLDLDLFRQIAELLPVGLYVVTPERRIIFWNAAAEHITGYLAQEVIGRSCGDGLLEHCAVLGNPLCDTSGCVLACALHQSHEVEALLFARHKDGRRLPVYVKSIPLYGPDGAVCAIGEAFLPQGSGPELRSERNISADAGDGLAIPSVSATDAYLRSRLQAPGTSAVFLIAVSNLRELARQRGLEMVHAAMRALVHTISDLLPMPHFLGRWHDQHLMVVVPAASGEAFTELLSQLRGVGNSLTVLWWGDRITTNVVVRGALVRNHEAFSELLARLASHVAEENR